MTKIIAGLFILLPIMASAKDSSGPIPKELQFEEIKVDYIECRFTEPYIRIEFIQTETRSALVIFDVDHGTSPGTIAIGETKNKPYKTPVAVFTGKTEIQFDGGAVVESDSNKDLYLVKNNKGSDGASDKVYPYDATYNAGDFTLYGGCEDKTRKMYVPKALLEK